MKTIKVMLGLVVLLISAHLKADTAIVAPFNHSNCDNYFDNSFDNKALLFSPNWQEHKGLDMIAIMVNFIADHITKPWFAAENQLEENEIITDNNLYCIPVPKVITASNRHYPHDVDMPKIRLTGLPQQSTNI